MADADIEKTGPENLEPLVDAQTRFREQGFAYNFAFRDGRVIVDGPGDDHPETSYEPAEVAIIASHREEGDTDPGDESILFALEAPDGVRGLLASHYGPDSPHADAIRALGTRA
ncbi:MAG: hypothetical protein ACI867_001296 [Glaciecola sp.]|jgi:hypothetical protein